MVWLNESLEYHSQASGRHLKKKPTGTDRSIQTIYTSNERDQAIADLHDECEFNEIYFLPFLKFTENL